MNPNNPTLVSSSRKSQARSRLLPFTASRVGKLAACLILGVATLSQSARSTPSYATAVLSENPLAFWQLNETGDPTTGTLPAADSTGHGYNGTYGATSQIWTNGILAPQPPTYPGFATGQGALQCAVGDLTSPVKLPALNLNTNTVTIAMWINPSGGQANFTGLLMNRTAGGDAAGLAFSQNPDGNGMPTLGYYWNNNNSATYNFNSGLYPVAGIWQFAAVVVAPNSATIYLYYTNNGSLYLGSAVHSYAHNAEAFSIGGTFLGSDVNQNNVTAANNVFGGDISGAAVFTSALTSDQILALFAAGLGVQGFPPSITRQPQSQYVVSGSSARLSATGINGTGPLAYQWTLNGTNINSLIDPTNFIGANSNVLTVLSVAAKDAGSYQLIVTNTFGTAVSSNAALVIQSPALVGEWLNGTAASTNLVDVSGYSLAANHAAYLVSSNGIGTGNLVFTNDAPPGKTGYSAFFFNGDTGLAISNSSMLDADYDSTFDNQINNAFTVTCWGKGFPAAWVPFVSKWGEGPPYNSPNGGWQLRADGNDSFSCFTVRDLNAGGLVFGNSGDALDDMATTNYPSNDTGWHFYAGTFDAVTGIRCLYVDAVLAAQETNNVAYDLAPFAHLCIGAKDSPPGNTFGSYSTTEIYDVRIYNCVTNVVPLYGVIPVVINGQPQNVLSFTNLPAQFQATVGGTAPINYQWQFNGTNIQDLADSANFTGANSSTLTILSVSLQDAGLYQLIASNVILGATYTVVSSNATLTIAYPSLVGEWFNGPASLADVSGYRPAGTHDGYAIGSGNYSFSDPPPLRPGQSLNIGDNSSGIAISNSSSTLDANYVNTFDTAINSAMTVAFWAKGAPGSWSWNPWVSKYGEGPGWQFREGGGPGVIPCWTVRDNGAGSFNPTNGGGPSWSENGDQDDLHATIGGSAPLNNLSYYNIDSNWHFYTGTYDSHTGIRNLYVDGVLLGQETGNVLYNLAMAEHLCIGVKDQPPGNNFVGWGGPFSIYDVRLYNYALTYDQVQQLLAVPSNTVPQIVQQPPASVSTTCAGITVQIGAIVGGGGPMTNQWQLNGTNLVDGNYGGVIITGSKSVVLASGYGYPVLTIANVTTNFQGVYTLTVSNAFGGAVSSGATLTVGTLPTAPAPAANLVGAWLTGAAKLADTSGYSPAGKHDASVQSGSVSWTSDVPPIAAPGSSALYFNNAGLVVSNSSTLDAAYTSTFDYAISNSMTIMCWAKGWPGTWNPWVSKYGENGIGWQLRCDGWNTACWTIRGTGGTEDMGAPNSSNDGFWHHYAGTYDLTTGDRNLYIDGNLAATQTGQGQYVLSAISHLMIGARDGGGNNFGSYLTGEIYGVQIYDTALSAAQINSFLQPSVPTFTGSLVINGNQLVLTYIGTLLQATNVVGPYLPVAGATSPCSINMTNKQMFFRLSNP